jgi:molecular chaperone GrpE
MSKKKEKNQTNEMPEEQEQTENKSNEPTKAPEEEQGQAMVALTFDEYDALQNQISTLKNQSEKNKEGWLRERADFTNYKKRLEKDASRTYQNALSSVIKMFLSVMDDLERALRNRPEHKEVNDWAEGIQLIYQKLLKQLKNLGVEQMEDQPGDAFDPNIHEAVTQEDHPDYKDGQIIEVVQPGYRISDRVIRPAMVRVAR